MKKLLEIQDQYIEALKEEVSKPIELLTAAKFAAGNCIGDCNRCTPENPCSQCNAWAKVWDDIEAYLEDNRS